MTNPKPQLVGVTHHVKPRNLSDRVAFGFTKLLCAVTDEFFAKRYVRWTRETGQGVKLFPLERTDGNEDDEKTVFC